MTRQEATEGSVTDKALPLKDLQSTGMLWLINRVAFHSRGFALAMVYHGSEFAHWVLLGDGSEPWRFEGDEDDHFARAEETLRAGAGMRRIDPSAARRIVAQRFQDERGVDSDIAADRILNDLAEAGHLPSTYAADTRGAVVNDLISWLRQQLDTDAEMAQQAACANPGAAARHWSAEQVERQSPTDGLWRKCWAIVPKKVKGIVLAEVPTDILPRVVKHIEAHDPARVLRQVQAHRAILDELWDAEEGFATEHTAPATARAVIRRLVSIYSDRDGYKEEWSA